MRVLQPEQKSRVVVVGGGLAGLTAAVAAARRGADVTLLDAHPLGGRARTTTVEPGVVFNSGARAFYAGGDGARILAGFGIDPTGGVPPSEDGRAMRAGELFPLPGAPIALLRTRLLSVRSKLAVAKVLGTLQRLDADAIGHLSVSEWMTQLRLAADARALLQMVIRTATYTAEIDTFSADAALRQVQLTLGSGVEYLDAGFQQLVDALTATAVDAGVSIVDHSPVASIQSASIHAPSIHATAEGSPDDRPGRWEVETTGRTLPADAVVLAVGGPESTRALSPVPLSLDGLGDPATAACLELAVRGPVAQPIVLGVDEPLYLSVHQPPADLAPAGISVVHAMRYGARSAAEDTADLWRIAELGGITADRVVAQRFLARMVVMGGLPIASAGGLAGRPAVTVADADGLFLAGDWVGPIGMLADAAIASGSAAGIAASTTSAVATTSAAS